MTTYYEKDSSPHDGSPYELFAFEGYEKQYYYTSKGEDVVYNGKVYKAIQMSRGALVVGDLSSQSQSLSVKVDILCALAQDSIKKISRPALKLTIFRMQRGATGYRKIAAGITAGFDTDFNGKTVNVSIKTKQQVELARNIAPAYFQNKCNNEFGDARCQFDTTTVRTPITVLEVNEARTLVTIAETHIPGEFEAGWIIIDEQVRRIISNDVSTIKIAYPFTGDVPPVVFIQRGCKRDYASCQAYNNTEHFTGFRDIPSTNAAQSPLNQLVANFEGQKTQDLVTVGKAKPLGEDTSNNAKPGPWMLQPVTYAPSSYVPAPDYTIVRGKYPPT